MGVNEQVAALLAQMGTVLGAALVFALALDVVESIKGDERNGNAK